MYLTDTHLLCYTVIMRKKSHTLLSPNATQGTTENAAENCSIAPSYTDVAPDEDTKGNEPQTNNDFDVFHRDPSLFITSRFMVS